MNALLIALALAMSLGVAFVAHPYGAGAVLVCSVLAVPVALVISQSEHKIFLLRVFAAALFARMVVGTAIHLFDLQVFFGADAYTYDELGRVLAQVWAGGSGYIGPEELLGPFLERNWGMIYVVAGIYTA
ncbi:MAG TPA: hypothetical protein VF064_06640, partial [Pyrinomonadaceae bacterium]